MFERLADVEDAADIRVRDLARDADLGEKSLAPHGIGGERARQEFQRDRSAELEVVGAVHLAHPAATEQPDDAISPGDHTARREAPNRIAREYVAGGSLRTRAANHAR